MIKNEFGKNNLLFITLIIFLISCAVALSSIGDVNAASSDDWKDHASYKELIDNCTKLNSAVNEAKSDVTKAESTVNSSSKTLDGAKTTLDTRNKALTNAKKVQTTADKKVKTTKNTYSKSLKKFNAADKSYKKILKTFKKSSKKALTAKAKMQKTKKIMTANKKKWNTAKKALTKAKATTKTATNQLAAANAVHNGHSTTLATHESALKTANDKHTAAVNNLNAFLKDYNDTMKEVDNLLDNKIPDEFNKYMNNLYDTIKANYDPSSGDFIKPDAGDYLDTIGLYAEDDYYAGIFTDVFTSKFDELYSDEIYAEIDNEAFILHAKGICYDAFTNIIMNNYFDKTEADLTDIGTLISDGNIFVDAIAKATADSAIAGKDAVFAIVAAYTELEALIEFANDIDGSAYTADTYADLLTAIGIAETFLSEDKTTLVAVTDAIDALQAAIAALTPVVPPVDYSALVSLIADAKLIADSDAFVDGAWAALQIAIAAAEDFVDNDEADSADDVVVAVGLLQAAIDALTPDDEEPDE